MVKILSFVVLILAFVACFANADNSKYVGHEACKDCHEQEYEKFMKYSKKAKSDKSVKIMSSKLTDEEMRGCYECHTTGYGKPGGFVSYEKTPNLGIAGCEVCHGPGSEHVDSGGDSSMIKVKMDEADCTTCHNEERVSTFNFKPLVYSGAH